MTPRRPLLLAAALPLLAACGAGTASLQASAPAATTVPADLAPLRPVHADHVLVAGDSIDLTTATGRLRVKVNGPQTGKGTLFGQRTAGALHHYLATFTITVTRLSGDVSVSPADFRLLAIADQVDGGGIVTHEASASSMVGGTGTWTAPFVEGHGEFLYTPQGASRPAALWDFRVEA